MLGRMPIEGMIWDGAVRALEVHVLAGTKSEDLRERLYFISRDVIDNPTFPSAKQYLSDHQDVSLTFTIADASKPSGDSTRTLPGVTLNAATGEVQVAAALPARFAQNFLVEVTAKGATGDALREMIRVHVHRSIQNIWLTPGTLKVRPRRGEAFPQWTDFRFALRARFDDETVGDITTWSQVEWSSKRGSVPTSNVYAADGTFLLQEGDVAAASITVSARLGEHPALGSASATLRVIEPWRPESPVDVRLVPGAGKPPTPEDPDPNPELIAFALDAVPNVLFLPDGFPAGEKETFFKYASSAVTFIKNNSLCKPYDVLSESINFWAAFIPSDRAGITWGSEVFAKGSAPDLTVLAVPKPRRPLDRLEQKPWELPDLIYEVGLATPLDRPENTARTTVQIKADWQALFGSHFESQLPTTAEEHDALLAEWRALGRRRLLDDVDTPLGVMSGAPRVDVGINVIDLNPDRMDRRLLNDLMGVLRHDQAATSKLVLDKIWTNPRKRNYDLVCIITFGQGREKNGSGYFLLSQDSDAEQKCTLTGFNDIVPVPLSPKDAASPGDSLVFAHELSHSFNLGDEYARVNDRPLFPAAAELVHRLYANVQSDSTLRVAGELHGDEIKWRWPRIRWAVELTGAIVDEGGGVFSAPIRMRHGFGARPGELVHFRFRDIDYAYRPGIPYNSVTGYLTKLPLVSVPFRLVEVTVSGTPPVKRIRVKVDDAASFPYPATRTVFASQLEVSFSAGSIVYAPTKAPPGVYDAVDYPYAELVAKRVKQDVTDRKAPTGLPNPDGSLPEIPHLLRMDVPDWFKNAEMPLIVGLYEGGMGVMKGAFHPTGSCKMAGHAKGERFCHVCRYTLVDAIDPSRHLFIDQEYSSIYPEE